MNLFYKLAGVALALCMASVSFCQQGSGGWTLDSVKGTYIFTEQGETGTVTPFAAVGVMTLDGSGNVSGSESAQTMSGVIDIKFTGTYSINTDGSGSLLLTNTTLTTDEDGNAAIQTFSTKYKFFPANKNLELKAVRLDTGTFLVSSFTRQ